MPLPVTEYVIKVHGRCDLACDHCYVYELADQSWRRKPAAIAPDVLRRAAERIAGHARAHALDGVHVILHGGEPLLLGHQEMRKALEILRETLGTRLIAHLHTNGVRLDEHFCDLFTEYGVRVGVSLDGDRTANDLHRRFRNGRGSHPEVLRALALLRRPEYRPLYSGLLCTIDIRNDPIAVYEALLAEDPPRIDFLFPHATWDQPPPRPDGVPAPYADWLGTIHHRWVADGRPVPVRLFDSLASAAAGGSSASETIGLDPVRLLVVETNGDWEQADSLKAAYDGAPATAMNVFDHSVDQAAGHPAVAARAAGADSLCATCRACPIVRICGGGLYAHRYRTGSGFANPSAYCDDLKQLIGQVTATVRRTPTHTLPDGALEALAAGPGSVEAITALAETQLTVTRALVSAVAGEPWRGDVRLKGVANAGWELLCELDKTHPDAVREVFSHPFVRAWATRCLRPPEGADPALDRTHLANLAAAAATLAGVPGELEVAVRDGAVYLPAVGSRPAASAPLARLGPGGWERAHRITGLTVTLEDLDPFRDCATWTVERRLEPAAARAWSTALGASIARLTELVPAYARVIAAGLRAIVPLRTGPAHAQQAATARHAFGAVALGRLDDPERLAALLLHEFQHVKLYALMDQVTLTDPGVPPRRQVEGVLHGIYAHLAAADLWRGHPDQTRHRRHRAWVEQAIDDLAGTGALTDIGARFVSAMREAVEGRPRPS